MPSNHLILASALLLCSSLLFVSALSQRDILIELYKTTNGTGWLEQTRWLSADECTWSGVGCDYTTGLVSRLELPYNRLSGTIPSSLAQLKSLDILLLNDNQLYGTIPSSLGNLTQLRYFFLSNNQLWGTIPSSLGQLSKLISFGLDTNLLSGTIPAFLGQMPLIEVYLNSNLFQSVSASISRPNSLLTCDMSKNPFRCPLPRWVASNCKATCD